MRASVRSSKACSNLQCLLELRGSSFIVLKQADWLWRRDGGVDLGGDLGRVPTFWVFCGRRRLSCDGAAATLRALGPRADTGLGGFSLFQSQLSSQAF